MLFVFWMVTENVIYQSCKIALLKKLQFNMLVGCKGNIPEWMVR